MTLIIEQQQVWDASNNRTTTGYGDDSNNRAITGYGDDSNNRATVGCGMC